jgi:carboxypeptidase Q
MSVFRRSFPAARLSACLLLAGCGGAAAPQTAPAPVAAPGGPAAVVPAPTDARHAASVAAINENAFVLLDLIGGRMSGQESGERAQRFAHERLSAYGLDDVRLEPFPLLGWERGPASMVIQSPAVLRGREVRVTSLGHVGYEETTAELVDAGFGTAEEIYALGARLPGRIAMIRVGQPAGYGRSVHRTEKLTLLARGGAVGMVMVAPTPGTLVQVGVATLGDEAAPIPAVGADFETGTWLLRVLDGLGEPVVARLATANRMGPAEAANVLADLRGRSDEVVLAGGHLDSWDLGTGALDNGSGTLVVLEAARLLAERVRQSGERPLRTIRWALWMGEELGLYGSRHHVREAVDRGALNRYRAVVNLDMVGAPLGFGAMDRPEAMPLLRPVIEALRPQSIVLDTTVAIGGGLYSDHQPFLLEGVPILYLRTRFQEGAVRFYHSAGDTRDKIDEPDLALAAVAVAELMWHLATQPELPLAHWSHDETGRRLERMGLRDPLERGGEWRWP